MTPLIRAYLVSEIVEGERYLPAGIFDPSFNLGAFVYRYTGCYEDGNADNDAYRVRGSEYTTQSRLREDVIFSEGYKERYQSFVQSFLMDNATA